MTTDKTPAGNTKASCGRNDPAWKHQLSEIPIAGTSINERGEEFVIYAESDKF